MRRTSGVDAASRNDAAPRRNCSTGSSDVTAAVMVAVVQLELDLLVDRAEQILLGREVVVQRPACHAGALDDVFPSRGGEAALGEQRPGGREQRGPGLLAALGLGAPVTSVTLDDGSLPWDTCRQPAR